MNKMDTKSKILEVAQELFAEKGYDGASIRDIASRAGVNVASINYHFENKKSLYWAVFFASHEWLASETEKISKECKDLSDLIWKLFLFMQDQSKSLRNAFMIMLSDSVPDVDEEIKKEIASHKEMGPPGGEHIFKVITDEVGDQTPFKLREWAVEVLFSNVVHWALIMSGTRCRDLYGDHPKFQMDDRQESFKRHVDSVLHYLRSNS